MQTLGVSPQDHSFQTAGFVSDILVCCAEVAMVILSVLILDAVWCKALNVMYNKEGVSNWSDIYFV